MVCAAGDPRDPPEMPLNQPALFVDDLAAFRAVLGADLPVAAAVDALTRCSGDTERAIKWLLDDATAAGGDGGRNGIRESGVEAEPGIGGASCPSPPPPLLPVKVEAADEGEVKVNVKREPIDATDTDEAKVKVEACGEAEVKVKVEAPGGAEVKVKREPIESDGHFQEQSGRRVKQEEVADEVDVKEEQSRDSPIKGQLLSRRRVKEDPESDSSEDEVEIVDPAPRSKKRPRKDDGVPFIDLTTSHPVPYLNAKPIRALPPQAAMPVSEWRMVVAPPPPELDEYPPDRHEWCFFKKSYATGLSTCRGRKLLDAGEVVHFAFPSYDRLHGSLRVSVRQAAALAEIVRFSTNRSGEVRSCNYIHSHSSYICAYLSFHYPIDG